MGKQAPSASTSQQIEDGIDDFPIAMESGTPMDTKGGEKRSNAVPFCIAHVS